MQCAVFVDAECSVLQVQYAVFCSYSVKCSYMQCALLSRCSMEMQLLYNCHPGWLSGSPLPEMEGIEKFRTGQDSSTSPSLSPALSPSLRQLTQQ